MRALIFSAILLAGCGGSQAAAPASAPAATPPPAGSAATAGSGAAGSASSSAGPSVDSMLVKMSEFKDKICACPDQTCVEGVSDEMKKWTDDLKQQGVKDPRLNDDQTKRATEIGEALGKCMRRIGNMGG
ncbi:MAG TPA: hypothetical protein VH143_02870 [Kofleriaceae bacterium]|jgi:hypothetical protein|nr:hypothetical protein [Kofleriaceae bacterium]